MALALASSSVAFHAPQLAAGMRASAPVMSGTDDLAALAKESNPVVGFWDPLNLSEQNFWNQGQEATIGFLRHAEIKHGRVAMAAFVGYCVQSNGIKFPFEPYTSITATAPPDQWDALPEAAKWQIIVFIGFLEVYSEHSFILEKQGQKHYMRGGKPGYFPENDSWPHPVGLNLYDPFNTMKEKSAEAKADGLVKELNNGRLAMIGIMGFVAEAKIPGSVPWGPHLPAYLGEVMQPFNSDLYETAWTGF